AFEELVSSVEQRKQLRDSRDDVQGFAQEGGSDGPHERRAIPGPQPSIEHLIAADLKLPNARRDLRYSERLIAQQRYRADSPIPGECPRGSRNVQNWTYGLPNNP